MACFAKARPSKSSRLFGRPTSSISSRSTLASASCPPSRALPTPRRSARSSDGSSSKCSTRRRTRCKGPSAVIKSHHNVGGLPERMNLKLIEPLRELFKDEVRAAGQELGMPRDMLWRHPFPGPGLAVRCLGEVTEKRLQVLRAADAIVVDEIRTAGLYDTVWQAFAVLLPVKSVGVMGDERTYEEACAVRAVHSVDGMTADWAKIPYDVLARISNRIINEVRGINRVVLDITSKPPGTIEWE